MDNFNDKYKKKNPFTVPEGYFEGLNEQIMSRLEKQGKPQKPGIVQIFKPYMGLVAVFVVALLVVQALMPLVVEKDLKLMPKNAGEEMAQVTDTLEEDIFDCHFNPTSEEIIEYLASEMDNYELMYAGIY